ncbi:MAG: GHMP kinase [Candidatus Sumerlaeia bacterium]|nr:GHMP kinase [Candidatus Sumerlaeia bacterium]
MIIEAIASNRVGDFGGWADTWFAKHGAVVNFAVDLFARVTIQTRRRPGITIHAQNFGEVVEIPDLEKATYRHQHALLIAALKVMKIKQGLDVWISADVPAGCGTGSSAAVSVAMIKGLSVLCGEPLVAHEVARLAHSLETRELKIQSGIQDQIAAANGGINYIEMYEYPNAYISHIDLPETVRMALENRWVLVYEGARHLSSDVHLKVIAGLKKKGSKTQQALDTLRTTAAEAKKALLKGDLESLAEVMNVNNRAQKDLHPEITTDNFEMIEDVARRNGMIGAMINGAGGGGSILLLCKPGRKFEVERALLQEGFRVLPCRINPYPARAWVAG